ncbi:MAG: hypothetical protein M3Q27_16040, partial [Actinomycetota bacterium]|nr:hypothetical protein [Actinomycetota bacterium]
MSATDTTARRLGPASPEDAADLAAFARALQRFEPLAAVRLQAHGDVVAAWARPPFGVLVMIAARLREPLVLDATVHVAALASAAGDDPMSVIDLPPDVPA